jgi:hypothetical protein
MTNKTRNIGWLIAAGLLAAALVAPSAVFAIDGSNEKDGGIAWNDPEFLKEDCEEELGPGEVLWHFVQNQLPEGITSGLLSITATVGGNPVAINDIPNSPSPANVLHWYVPTPEAILLTFTSNVGGDGNLVLGHICYGGPEEESESPSDVVESESPSDVVESEEPSGSVDVETEEPSGSVDVETEEPSGSVEEVTGTPEEEKTPPQTDTIGAPANTASNSGLQMILLGLAALVATALIVTPSHKRR